MDPFSRECLVVRSALSATSQEDSQREAIFQTRCTVGGKVCSLIINGGSCTNVASQTLVDKLNLEPTPHPKPYVIQWLNQDKGIQVNLRILVSFSIGKTYQEELCCDVIPMDACHILLGRPWLYDRRADHDGYRNTYSFVKDQRKITLTPLNPNKHYTPQKDPSTPKNITTTTTTLNSNQKEIKETKPLIPLTQTEPSPLETPPQDKPHHSLFTPLLCEPKPFFPKDHPFVLPPKGSIQQKIEVIPKPIFSSKPSYRIDPKEGFHEWLVVTYGFTNTPSTNMRLMN